MAIYGAFQIQSVLNSTQLVYKPHSKWTESLIIGMDDGLGVIVVSSFI